MDLQEVWLASPPPVRVQTERLLKYFAHDSRVRRCAEFITDKYGISDQKTVLQMAILQVIRVKELLDPGFFTLLYAFDNRGNTITLQKVLTKGSRVCLINGKLKEPTGEEAPVVIKWYRADKRDIKFEIDIYRQLRSINCPLPWVSSGFYFFTSHVLVMEPLKDLDVKTNIWEMCADVIAQLRYLHQFATHNDIKPGNIMEMLPKQRRPGEEVTETDVQKKYRYVIIDYGGCTIEWLDDCLRRKVWSPRYCRQEKGRKQKTCAYWDFEELMVTARCIELKREGKSTKLCHTGWTGNIIRFMKLMRRIVPKDVHLTPETDHAGYHYIYDTLEAFCRRLI